MKRILILVLVCLLALLSVGCQVVTGGNYALRSGETLSGALAITGGQSTLEQGSRVTGSLFVTGGTVNANGQIDGNVSLAGGSINFGPSAVVRGVLQKTGGDARIAAGASVQSSEFVGVRTPGRLVGNLATMFFLFPLVLIVVVVLLVMTRTNRRGEPQMTVAKAPADAGLAPKPLSAPAERGMGLGGGIVVGVILIALGILFLFEELLNADVWHYAWPLLTIVPGLTCFAVMVVGGKNAGHLAIPGSLLTGLGLIFLAQNAFDQFQTWAYAWALIIPTIGVGRLIEGWWSDRPALRTRGIRLIWSGLIVFILFAAFFELVLNLSGFFGGDVGRFAFPALLILIGVLLLFGRFINWPAAQPAMQMPAGTATLSAPTPTDSDRQLPAQP